MCSWEIRFLELDKKYRDLVIRMTVDKFKNSEHKKTDFIDITLKMRIYTQGQTVAKITDLFTKSIREQLMKKSQLELF